MSLGDIELAQLISDVLRASKKCSVDTVLVWISATFESWYQLILLLVTCASDTPGTLFFPICRIC